jgi:chorismate dehydratase
MPKFTVGSVPYVNAIPLVAKFELEADAEVRVIYDVPSRLPALMESGEADAILVSSVDALRNAERRMVDRVCIGSDGPVKSVRLFSKVPPAEIASLALDQSSMTSNRLAQIILSERYGAHPRTEPCPPDQATMLAGHDACVLIGDIGMLASSESLHVLDLGEEFTDMTGKPFVWAGWIGKDRLTHELADHLRGAAEFFPVGLGHAQAPGDLEKLVSLTQLRSGWSDQMIRDYYLDVMLYRMDERAVAGLRDFRSHLLSEGFDDCRHFPALV